MASIRSETPAPDCRATRSFVPRPWHGGHLRLAICDLRCRGYPSVEAVLRLLNRPKVGAAHSQVARPWADAPSLQTFVQDLQTAPSLCVEVFPVAPVSSPARLAR